MSKKKPPGSYYKVGYGKPPKHTQFKKGQSGNRGGRPKGAINQVTDNNLYAIIDREASRIVSVTNGDHQLSMTMANLVIKTLTQLAAKGNTRAMAMFLEHLRILDEEGLAEQARLAKQREEEVNVILDSMSDEHLEEFLRLSRRRDEIIEAQRQSLPPRKNS